MNTQDPDQERDDGGACSSPDSLFDGELELDEDVSLADAVNGLPAKDADARPAVDSRQGVNVLPARRTPPPIPGLFLDPHLRVPADLARDVYEFCKQTYFRKPKDNQVMLFERAPDPPARSEDSPTQYPPSSSLPATLLSLLRALAAELAPVLPPNIHALLFPATPSRARQIIINLYAPGEGISAHVDLLRRYGDGIIGVSLGSGCVMRFRDVGEEGAAHESYKPVAGEGPNSANATYDVYLPEGSVYVMTGDARYRWTHGIERKRADYVEREDGEGAEWIERGERISVTFRWMLEGGDVL
ncbi:uncharacterized protein SCHCODRAFT_02506202 [Schizophyllum commune H4-8]|uniref:Fe2OG dioxygenase domain-containing protein n=1 Tax=Schizophyllum commune (strain H4-8 / FGSC 9210) TaxID=578458 RepID=D8Q783_SCHCM|nr:uncharacterized protein SCHCODRAFT_02506202 [Schizophyllum commune H4-8]KAI5891600.1 hypothetical protein SCHCODRAFT_02506202 [Schizophyllum commune H4-8]